MSDVGRGARSIPRVHYGMEAGEEPPRPLALPSPRAPRVTTYPAQVAGHRGHDNAQYIGLLQCSNGTIMKPILKPGQRREVDFYELLQKATEADLVELRQLVPRYYGCVWHEHDGLRLEYIVLEDLTAGMLEPCIMDVKIGKKTWDHLASEEKIKREECKYARCKQEYGFCIPGFQVYRVRTGQLATYDKEYGKKLHGDAVKQAIRRFLNAEGGGGACRALVMRVVCAAWRVQRWARSQRRLTLRAASLLLRYDAQELRDCCAKHDNRCTALSELVLCEAGRAERQYRAALHALTHASDASHAHHAPHAHRSPLTLIDFAHAHLHDTQQVDENFRDGLDSFVKVLEEILESTELEV